MAAPITNVNWARPDATYYDNLDKNSGEATFYASYTYRGWVGLHYQINRNLGFFLRGAYLKYDIGNAIDSEAPTDSSGYSESGYSIQSNWMESIIQSDGGITIQSGIQIWMFE